MICDTHLHTSFSEDCSTPPEDVIKRAAELGMREICITDHYDRDFPFDGWVFDPDAYFRTLLPLKEQYKDVIDVHIGIEIGLQPHLKGFYEELLKAYPFEFVIGSIHVLLGDDPYYRERYDCTDGEYYRAYFEYMLESVSACAGVFDSLGHLDYVVRYGYGGLKEYSYERFAEYIGPVLDILVRNDTALEINTGALKYGKDIIHPDAEVIRQFLARGGRKFSAGSDAHRSQDVGRGLDRAEEYLKSFGKTFTQEQEKGFYIYLK